MPGISPEVQALVENAFEKLPTLEPGTHAIAVIGLGSGALTDRLLSAYGPREGEFVQDDSTSTYRAAQWKAKRGLPVWVVEPETSLIERALSTFDWSEAVESGQLCFFAGPTALDELEQAVTHPLSIPFSHWVASPDSQLTAAQVQEATGRIQSATERWTVAYSRAREMRKRQALAIQGDRSAPTTAAVWSERYQPGKRLRILVCGVRFGGSYLAQCSASLAQGFERHGHEVRLLQEVNNFQNITPASIQHTITDFNPELIVWINGTRSYCNSAGICTEGIPFCTWAQDPPIMVALRNPNAVSQRSELDFYISSAREWSDELERLGYGETPTVKVPTDPGLFSMSSHPGAVPFGREFDVSYIATLHPDAVRTLFEADSEPAGGPLEQKLYRAVYEEQERRLANDAERLDDNDYRAIMAECLPPDRFSRLAETPKDMDAAIRTLEEKPGRVAQRSVPLAWLSEAGHDLGIFGPGWEGHPVLGQYAHGLIPYGAPMAAMFRASRIHICIHSHWTVTMKVFDCLATGTFPLVYWVSAERDTDPITNWYQEDRDVVLFRYRDELLDKTRYYLKHPEERRKIALRGREITLRNFTYDHLAAEILSSIRGRILPGIERPAG